MNEEKCPQCGKSNYSVGMSTRTLAYYQPIFEDGINVNPDRNITTTQLHCRECGHDWEDKS